MSRSQSPTPTPNIPPSTSRPDTATTHNENIPSNSPREHTPRPSSVRPLIPSSSETRQTRPPLEPDFATLTMARQIRGTRTQHQHSRDDDSTSSSQSDPDDTSSRAHASEETSHAPQTSAPVKQKRTRTLTTPHQAAVLHALLAESRFPTTAMREEVGRSIGLSARKVQIWFQNQRQKARRPQSSSSTGAEANPPQYGVFPDLSPEASRSYPTPEQGSSSGGSSRSYTSMVTFEEQQQLSPIDSRRGRDHHHPSTIEPLYTLVGPGMPGPTLSEERVSPPPLRPHSAVFRSSPISRRHRPYPEIPEPTHPSSPVMRPFSHGTSGFSRTLPPLLFEDRRSPRSVSGPRFSTSRTMPSLGFEESSMRISPTDSLFAHRIPDEQRGTRLTADSPVVIPPPFTLQPQPQWDNGPPYHPASSRPHSAPWYRTSLSFPSSDASSPTSDVSMDSRRSSMTAGYASLDRPRHPGATVPDRRSSESAALARPARYDPVRATFIPYTHQAVSSEPSGQGSQENLPRLVEEEDEQSPSPPQN